MLEKKVNNFIKTEGISINLWKYVYTAITDMTEE
jgi:hypothetical protein